MILLTVTDYSDNDEESSSQDEPFSDAFVKVLSGMAAPNLRSQPLARHQLEEQG